MTGQRFCPTCGERMPNDPKHHFCMFCGSFSMLPGGQENQTMPDEAGAYVTKEIRFCPYCRAEIINGLKFCDNCRKMLPKAPNTHAVTETPEEVTLPPTVDVPQPQPQTEELQPVEDVPQPETVQPTPSYTPPPQKKNNTLLILAVVLFGLVFVALVGFVVAVSSSGSKSSEYAVAEDYTPSYEEDEAKTRRALDYEEAAPRAKNADEKAAPSAEAVNDTDWRTQYDFACERILTESDLLGMNAGELRIMRNWIFARHGYIFRTQELKDYFSQYPWYNPRYTDVSSMLSDVEIKNAEFIKRHE